MNVTLLGGSGFIGSHLADALVRSGHRVTIFHSRGGSSERIAHLQDAARILVGDAADPDDIAAAVAGARVVVHLISSTIPGSSLASPTHDAGTNIVPSIVVFDRCVSAGVDKVVFASSGGTVYGVTEQRPISEDHPLNPISPYGISKVTVEKYLGMYSYQYGLDYTVLRLSNPFGPRQLGRGQGVLAAWMRNIALGAPIEIWGDGSVIRDYLYIDDAVCAFQAAIESKAEAKILNVGSGRGYSLIDLHVLMEEMFQRPIPLVFKEMQRADVPVNILDISLIAKTLGWRPQTEIRQGLRLMCESRDRIVIESRM